MMSWPALPPRTRHGRAEMQPELGLEPGEPQPEPELDPGEPQLVQPELEPELQPELELEPVRPQPRQ